MTRRGRPPTGCPKWDAERGIWYARLLMPSGSRRPVDMPGIPEHDVERAHTLAKALALRSQDGGFVPGEALETTNEWFDRWHKVRVAKGLRARDDLGAFWKWISPVIGTIAITRVERRDMERVVQALDAAVVAGKIAWKRAVNVWGFATKMMADASKSKVLGLRVRDDNPARDVEGPDRGVEKDGPYLFPAEFLALMRCDRVPVRWRRVFMLATYLYVRGGELEALEWPDVHEDRGYVHIHQSIDEKGVLKATKGKNVRKVPIEPTLLPLLRRMRDECGGEGRVITMPPREEWARRLRKYLGWAGVTRAELFVPKDHPTLRRLTFHDLRHTGITWRAIRGDDPMKVERAAGHDDLKTTQRYINEAETFEGSAFGEPFPAVDVELLTPFPGGAANTVRTSVIPAVDNAIRSRFPEESGRPQRESNPR
ncbi:MAG TPA: site-specific integrase [Polyangiaceae bacterium]